MLGISIWNSAISATSSPCMKATSRARREAAYAAAAFVAADQGAEEEIDAALFVRHPRGVALTDAGRSFRPMPRRCWPRSVAPPRGPAHGARRDRHRVGFTTSAPFHPGGARHPRVPRDPPDVSFVLEKAARRSLAGLRRSAGHRLHPLRPRRHRGAFHGPRAPAGGHGGRPALAPSPRAPAAPGAKRPRGGDLHPLSATDGARPLRRHIAACAATGSARMSARRRRASCRRSTWWRPGSGSPSCRPP
jgi:hypothetical protein